jgi:crotonobetainyl-CoA:carnitine CoA-transferase CaiB-like acyl-CoA transferase
VEIDVPRTGPIKMAGLPVKFTDTPGQIRRPPPRLGEHSADVLRRVGYSDAEIRAMDESGAVGLDRPA